MPQRNVATNFTFEQQRAEINLLAQDFWTHKGTVDTAASTYLKHDGSNAFTGGTLAVPNAFTINSNSGNGTVTISGNLDVTGTTTTVSSANLEVTDKNILISKGSTSDAQADGAGITIDSDTDITWNFVDANDAWVSSIGVEATTHLKAARGQFTGSGTPTTGSGVEINAPDANTGQIIAYNRGGTPTYNELRVKGTSVGVYTGSTNALVGTFNSTGLTMESGKTITGVLASASAAQPNITSVGTLSSLGIGVAPDSGEGSELAVKGTDGATNIALVPNADTESSQISFYNAAYNSTQGYIKYNNNDNSLQFRVNLQPRLHIKSDGHVGIGETDPAQLLCLKSADPRILLTETTNDSNCYLDYAAGGILEISVDDNNVDTSSKFQVRIDGATAGLTLDSTGLGLGTTSPTEDLEVKGDQTATIYINAGQHDASTANEATLKFGFNQSNANDSIGYIKLTENAGNSFDGQLTFGVPYNNSGTPATREALLIKHSGLVFIGGRTTAPNDINKLVVTGTSPEDAYDSTLYLEGSETTGAVDTGGALAFGGHDGSQYRNWANIYGMKENATGGNSASYMSFHTRVAGGSPAEKVRITSDGHVLPSADNTLDLGSPTKRWANLYTGDLNLCNEGSYNEVDGTSGSWTMQEGDSDLFLINRKSGKKYKFNLTEVA